MIYYFIQGYWYVAIYSQVFEVQPPLSISFGEIRS